MSKWDLPKEPKFYEWESPITKIYGEIENQITKQEEENYTFAIKQAIGYSVNKEELIKALQYDREQYYKGYRDGVKETFKAELENIKAEIANIPNDETTKPIGIYDYCLGAEHEREIILQIIDKHIDSLKGDAE